MIYSLLFNHDFELRSNSLTLTCLRLRLSRLGQMCKHLWLSLIQTFGNVSELSFLSLNHDFFTIHDVQTLCDLSLRSGST